MTNNSEQLQEAPAPQYARSSSGASPEQIADARDRFEQMKQQDGPRSIRDIITGLSKPVAARHLKQRTQGGRQLDYLPWYYAVKYLDHHAPGWSKEIRTITQIGENLVMVVRITVPCLEGEVYREASALEPIKGSGFGDCAVNAESAALRRAAAQFGLARYLYEK